MARRNVWLVVLAVAVSLPALAGGRFNDDWFHHLLLSGSWPIPHDTTFGLYEFIPGGARNRPLVDLGALPWFAHPELRAAFFRPLSSASIALDARLFGDRTWLGHAHSLLWWAVVVVLTWRIHQRLLPKRLAFWSTLVFALAAAHAESTTWVSSRHMLIAAAFGLGCWLVHLRWNHGWRAAMLSAALLLMAYTGSEAALAVVPFVLGYEWAGRRAPARERMLRSLPVLLPTLAYLVVYPLAGYGVAHAGGYVSPFSDPLQFVVAAARRVPVLVAELLTVAPSGLMHVGSGAGWFMAGLGLFAIALFALALRRRPASLAHEGVTLGWLWCATLVALVPLSATLIGGRVQLLPMVGSSCAVGILLGRLPPDRAWRGAARVFAAAGLVLLFVLHVGISPLLRVLTEFGLAEAARAEAALATRARLRCAKQSPILLTTGSDPALGMYGGAILASAAARRRDAAAMQRGFAVLTMAPNDLEIERLGPRRFELRAVGERLPNVLEQFYRSPGEPLRAGDRVVTRTLTAHVAEASAAGPARVQFSLPVTVDRACFVRWTGGPHGRLESFRLPEHGPLALPHVPGPLGF